LLIPEKSKFFIFSFFSSTGFAISFFFGAGCEDSENDEGFTSFEG